MTQDMLKQLLLGFIPLCLFATIIEPFSLDTSIGYREDTLRFRIIDPGDASTRIYQDKYKNLKFMQTELTLRKIQRDIYLWITGGYAFFGSSDYSQTSLNILNVTPTPNYQFNTSGWAAHVMALFGYCVNLTPERYYRVVFTPCAGYAGYWEHLTPKNPSPNPAVISTGGNTTDLFSNIKPKTHYRWNGWIVGGNIQIKPGNGAIFDLFYGYQFLQLRKTIRFGFLTQITDNNGNIISSTQQKFNGKPKTNGGHGHYGTVRAGYPFTNYLEGALWARVDYNSSHIQDFHLDEKTNAIFPSPSESSATTNEKFKFTQLTLVGMGQLSWKF
jgi:hypothetical protein